MNLSEKNRSALYDAIHESCMQVRIRFSDDIRTVRGLDHKIAQIPNEAWAKIKKILKLDNDIA